MAVPPVRQRVAYPLLHPLHAILLAFPVALFSSALATDITYLNSAEIQWTNFSQWLIAGGCLMGGLALLWAIVLVARGAGGRAVPYLVLVAAMVAAGVVNSFQHSRDGWSSVETTGLVLSVLTTLLALAAGWVGYSGLHADRDRRIAGERP